MLIFHTGLWINFYMICKNSVLKTGLSAGELIPKMGGLQHGSKKGGVIVAHNAWGVTVCRSGLY